MIKIGNYNFEGPYPSVSSLRDESGVYAIIDERPAANIVVDVGESSTVKSRVEGHDRKDCWNRNKLGTLKVAVLYTPNKQQSGRMEIEQEIRRNFRPSCGDR